MLRFPPDVVRRMTLPEARAVMRAMGHEREQQARALAGDIGKLLAAAFAP